ncbi:MAG: hypothetical protein CMJ83_13555 [Planctomycetes bacterium]|nr:hypothetical protein [Planctomycetota bacterium]
MDRKTFETLVNREIDGLLSPEEAARLNDWTTRNPEALAVQEALHRVHRAFQDMEPAECPPELAGQIADRVLAGPAPVVRFWSPMLIQRVAAAVLVVVCAGFAGFYLSNQETTATPSQVTEERVQIWVDAYELDRAVAREIVLIRAGAPDAQGEKAEIAKGRVLVILEKAGKLDAYREKNSMSLEEARRLIQLADG